MPKTPSVALGAVLGTIAKAVTRFGGVVNRQMGDGVMVLFGAPVATEDHAARACFAASRPSTTSSRMGDLALPIENRHLQRPRHPAPDGPRRRRLRRRRHHGAHSGASRATGRARAPSCWRQQTADLVAGVASSRIDRPDRAEGDRRAAAGLPSAQRRRPAVLERPRRRKALSTFVGRDEELRRAVGGDWTARRQARRRRSRWWPTPAWASRACCTSSSDSLRARHVAHHARGDHGAIDGDPLLPDHGPAARLRRRARRTPALPEVAARLPSAIASLGLERRDSIRPPFSPISARRWMTRLDMIDPAQRNRPPGALDAPDPAALCRSASPDPGGRGLPLARCVERRGAELSCSPRWTRSALAPAGDDAAGTPPRLARHRQHSDRDRAEASDRPAHADHLLQELIGRLGRAGAAARAHHRAGRRHAALPGGVRPVASRDRARWPAGAARLDEHRHSGVGAVHPGGAHRPAVAAAQAHPADRCGDRPGRAPATAGRRGRHARSDRWRRRSRRLRAAGFLVEVRAAHRHRSQLPACADPGRRLRQPAAQRSPRLHERVLARDRGARARPTRRVPSITWPTMPSRPAPGPRRRATPWLPASAPAAARR